MPLSEEEKKQHQREATRRWREKNKEKVREADRIRNKRYRARHPERIKEYNRKYRAAHKNDYKYRKALNRVLDPEYVEKEKLAASIRYKRYADKNWEKVKSYQRAYKKELNDLSKLIAENHYSDWTEEDIALLIELAHNKASQMDMAIALKRTVGSVANKLKKLRKEGLA